jgi:hypothetical protein
MPVGRIGPRCEQCGTRPADQDGLCRPCEALARAFGHHHDPHVTPSEEPEFDVELRRWLEEAA